MIVHVLRRAGFRPALRGLAPLLALSLLAAPERAAAQEPFPDAAVEAGIPVADIQVRGNQRLTAAAVRTMSGLNPGIRITAVDVQAAIRRMMQTGNFTSVDVYAQEGATGVILVLDVLERPLIARYEFEGLDRVRPRVVRDTMALPEGMPLDPGLVTRTEVMIRDLLTREGVQVLAIDTVLTPTGRDDGSYRLTFRVQEGPRLAIADVRFVGNHAFDDAALQSTMRTRPEGFWWFRGGRYDQEEFRRDLNQRLPAFYGSRGYIDFSVLSDSMRVDPETGKAIIVVEVSEGPQYRLGDFDVEGATRFSFDELARIYTAQRPTVLGLPFGRAGERERGEIFDRTALAEATNRVEQMYRNQGFLYAQVEPVVRRIPASETGGDPVVNVTWAISERSPFFINTITIVGNSTTHESVIRDRLNVFPGDVYNEDRLIQSYQSISALGFFETPLPTPDIQPDVERSEVNIVFHVREKQTASINFGTTYGGAGRGGGLSGFFGFSHPNLFGQAKQAELHAEYGWGRNTFRASYTDPSLFGSRNSGTASLFHMSDRYSPFNDGRAIRTGGSLRFGFPVANFRWTRGFVGYSLFQTRYQTADEVCDEPGSIFCLPTATASNVTVGMVRETKNHPLFPTQGTRQMVSVDQRGGPLGGDGNFQKLMGEFEWWVPVGTLGGDQPGQRPVRFALGLQARAGAIFGDAAAFPLDRFFLGGTQWGQQLRGYEESTITPFGFVARGPGVGSMDRLGDAYMTLTGEYAVRLNDNISVSAFAEAGNIWNDVRHFDPSRLFRSTGVGVTLVTPFGPMGIDYAYGFDRTPPGWRFHFKIGGGM
jgi:outer membrane protein insertion porin family